MTFSITTSEVYKEYEKPYLHKKERNISFVLIFIIPFLAILDSRFVFLTLIPWTITCSIIIHHYSSECAADPLDAIIIRDGYIEVDQYPSLAAVIHNDRFIDLKMIVKIDVTEYVSFNRRKGEIREARRINVHLEDGKVYRIDRVDFIINNAVRSLKAWNDSLSINVNGFFKESKVDFSPFDCDATRIGPPEFDGSRLKQISTAIICLVFAISLFILGLINDEEANNNPAMYILIWLLILIFIIIVIYYSVTAIEDSLIVPKNTKPYYMRVDESSIDVWFFDRPMMSFPWSSIRGIKASPTHEWHHNIEIDNIFHTMGKGSLVFDNVLFSIDVGIADQIQSIYKNKFGFYPNRYSFFSAVRAPTTHNYSELMRRPNYRWRNMTRN